MNKYLSVDSLIIQMFVKEKISFVSSLIRHLSLYRYYMIVQKAGASGCIVTKMMTYQLNAISNNGFCRDAVFSLFTDQWCPCSYLWNSKNHATAKWGNNNLPACHALRKLIKLKRANNTKGSQGPWQKFREQIPSSLVSEMHLHKSNAWQMAGLVCASGKANVLAVGQPAIFV